MVEQNHGFKNEWKERFPTWLSAQRDIEKGRQETPVKIIVLGPGSYLSEGYDKRKQIKEHLNLNPHNEAIFLEDWVNQSGRSKPEILREQGLYVAGAHVVVALLVPDSRATGVVHEISHYRGVFPDFEMKTWLFLPRHGGKEAQIGRQKALLWEGVRNFPKEHVLQYNQEEFLSCDKIRDYVLQKVDAARAAEFHALEIQKALDRRIGG